MNSGPDCPTPSGVVTVPAVIRAIRSALAIPAAYRAFGALIGAHAAREIFARDFVRARPGQRVLDIGCGPGTLFPYLGDVAYLGFDASPEYIAAAQSRYGERARFVCERVSDHVVEESSRFDVAVASGVLHHLDDVEARRLLEIASASLEAGGRLITLDGCFTPDQNPVARLLLSRDRGQFVRSKEQYMELATRVFPVVTATVRNDLLRIPYTHIILECEKQSPAPR